MSQRFVRCPHCALPHDVNEVRCPTTGLAISSRKYSARPAAGKAGESPQAPSVARIQAPRVPSFDPPSSPPRPAPGSQQKIPVAAPVGLAKPNAKPAVEGSLVGRVLSDKYGVTAIIGEGGMGAVYEAEHLTIGRLVALKVLHPVNAKRADAVQRFHHEARVAGSIGHPNICEIYDVGKLEDGSPYLVMERLHGETLADRIGREGALPFMDVIDIVIQILSALVAAHAKGVIHRDIKPENTFLSVRAGMPPVAKLLDFGISKVGTDEMDLHLTRTGMVMGTPYYMAPEQARGDRTIDQRVDLYAVGVILYESLTGRRPFLAPNYNALLVQILSGTPRAIRDIRPALPQGFDAMVDKALAKSRDNRYQTATEFLTALSSLRDNLARGPNPAELAKLAQRRMPSSRPPPKPAAPSVDIPVHFADPTGSAEYLSVASGELMIDQSSVSDTNPVQQARAEERPTMQDVPPVPRQSLDVGDTYVEASPRGSQELADLTEVLARALDGNTPVHGSELAMVRRQLRETDPTTVTAPLDPAQAEEIIRAARTRGPRVPLNPMQLPESQDPPAARPSKLSERPPVPREETAAARAALAKSTPKLRSPEDTSPDGSDDDQPTTFFRPNRPKKASVPPAEMLDDDDEIRDSLVPGTGQNRVHTTEPAPPPFMPAPVPLPPRPARRK